MMLDLLNKSESPVLALTGDKDVQTNSNQLIKIADLSKDNIEVHMIANMNHMLKYHEGGKSILDVKKHYKKGIKKPLHQTLKLTIKRGVKRMIFYR